MRSRSTGRLASTRSSAIRRTSGRSCSRNKARAAQRSRRTTASPICTSTSSSSRSGSRDRYCLIVPNKWMTAAYGRPLRELLARARSVEGIVDFARGLPLFGDADAFPCIVWGGGDSARADSHAARRRRASRSPTRSPHEASPHRARALDRGAVAHRRRATTPRCSIASPRAARRSATSCRSGRRAASSPAAIARS